MASAPDGAPLAMSMLGNVFGAGAGDAVDGEAALGRVELADAGRRLDDRPRPLEVRAAVEGPGLEEDALAGLDVGADPDHVDHAGAVGADRAALPAAGLGVVGRRGELRVRQVSPPSVDRANSTGSESGRAAEADVADVDVAEVRARLGVVGPDLLLVAEQRRVLPA